MNRETKFRGMTPYGTWEYGSLIQAGKANFILPEYVRREQDITVEYQLVKPDSVGEYTGLKDKNGQEIYEGDIIEWLGRKWEVHVDTTHGIRFMYGSDQITKSVADNCEVIGNIYENPELLEKAES